MDDLHLSSDRSGIFGLQNKAVQFFKKETALDCVSSSCSKNGYHTAFLTSHCTTKSNTTTLVKYKDKF